MAGRRGFIDTKSETVGTGCLVQLIGLLVIWWFPIGTVVGLGLLLWGHCQARFPICSIYGTRLTSRKVIVCPACNSTFK